MNRNCTLRSLTTPLATALTAVALVQPVHAAPPSGGGSGGIIEINQDKVVAGNVTPGDQAGFPVTLSQPNGTTLRKAPFQSMT